MESRNQKRNHQNKNNSKIITNQLNLIHMNTTSRVLLGISVAAAAGVVAGMLLAPEKGLETQQKIKETANDWLSKLLTALASGQEIATDATKKVVSATEEFARGASRTVNTPNN